MKKISLILMILILLFINTTFADTLSIDSASELEVFDSVNEPDGVALNGNWILEGNLGKTFFVLKKYFLISNPNVYILYGDANLSEIIKDNMPIINESLINKMINEENYSSLLNIAIGTKGKEKYYGSKKFIEYFKTQSIIDEYGNQELVNSYIDFHIKDGIIYVFSYNYIGDMEDFEDYVNALETFKTLSNEKESNDTQKINQTYNYNNSVISKVLRITLVVIVIICLIIIIIVIRLIIKKK